MTRDGKLTIVRHRGASAVCPRKDLSFAASTTALRSRQPYLMSGCGCSGPCTVVCCGCSKRMNWLEETSAIRQLCAQSIKVAWFLHQSCLSPTTWRVTVKLICSWTRSPATLTRQRVTRFGPDFLFSPLPETLSRGALPEVCLWRLG